MNVYKKELPSVYFLQTFRQNRSPQMQTKENFCRESGKNTYIFSRLVIPYEMKLTRLVNFQSMNQTTMNTVDQHCQDYSVQGAKPNLVVKMSVPIGKLRV